LLKKFHLKNPNTRKTVIIIFMKRNLGFTLTDPGFGRIRKIDLKGLKEGLWNVFWREFLWPWAMWMWPTPMKKTRFLRQGRMRPEPGHQGSGHNSAAQLRDAH